MSVRCWVALEVSVSAFGKSRRAIIILSAHLYPDLPTRQCRSLYYYLANQTAKQRARMLPACLGVAEPMVLTISIGNFP
ncbi:hypothetical protein DL89DRAFT_265909 [Linderina pennispora]|uniref:Uncharacterized protein n=1 Tax=Linderina pennispora TaxID=61395 RepID=A0A1Y1WFI1_9FUNG|nr:uncharacterized protein DL89DRAFT_265909 [Linderina pennispora]ORX72321.1 hypothetical protein DL89DRAFT_265909 [Linderina pennispora]